MRMRNDSVKHGAPAARPQQRYPLSHVPGRELLAGTFREQLAGQTITITKVEFVETLSCFIPRYRIGLDLTGYVGTW